MNTTPRLVASVIVATSVAFGSHESLATDDSGLTGTGLLPVHDASGETYGETFAWNMTPIIYQVMKEGGRELVLLNPGGGYSPLDEAGTVDFARSAGVRTIVVSRLLATQRSDPHDNSPRLRVEVKALDAQKGTTLHSFSLVEQVKRKDLDRGFDFGAGAHERRFLWIPGLTYQGYHEYSREVESQPLGKVIKHFAEAIRSNLLSFNGGALVSPSTAPHPDDHPASCAVDFNVRYVRQRATSKTYSLAVNGREESVGVTDSGIAQLTLRAGSNLFEVTVKDPPYRLPVQKGYAINRWMDCSPDERHLTIEIGSAGEALIVAKP
jgi:hypothetical protein